MKPVRFTNRPQKETDIQADALDYLEMRGVFCWRNNTGARGRVKYGKLGSPDIIGIMPNGRFIGVELKKPKGRGLSDNQERFHKDALRNNAVIIVVRSAEELHAKYDEIVFKET